MSIGRFVIFSLFVFLFPSVSFNVSAADIMDRKLHRIQVEAICWDPCRLCCLFVFLRHVRVVIELMVRFELPMAWRDGSKGRMRIKAVACVSAIPLCSVDSMHFIEFSVLSDCALSDIRVVCHLGVVELHGLTSIGYSARELLLARQAW